ncbi:MAG: hypothetical protein SangKO_013610 [Sandaracinaceae bacterium]
MSESSVDTGALEERRATPLARQAGASTAVYAMVTGLAGAVPIPMLDGLLSELSRGAAMRRVARRHGVALTPGARAILSGPGMLKATSSERGRLLKAAVASFVAPFRVAARAEDALGTLSAAIMLDHFLRKPGRPSGAALTEAEAHRIRAAMDGAVADAGIDALRTVPFGLWGIFRRGFDAIVQADQEGRSVVERFVDAILDGLADAPNDLVDTLTHHFDQVLERGGGTP